ncbi:MAG: HypC/HybG/HupF family hydrogenase formation chaperone [SAR324 cluster bacterium]|nr:HypC/HybG/HupF family hydrogenase formation chaperone [SAR324 cluster bacterium]
MCQAIPGEVLEIIPNSEPLVGRVDFRGLVRKICLDCVPDVAIGEYVIVHAGFAISKMDQEEAQKTLDLFDILDGPVAE